MRNRPAAGGWFIYLCVAIAALNAAYAGGRLLISYRVLELGGDTAVIGLTTALYSLVPLLAAMPVGRAVDGRHAATMLRIGAGVSAAAFALIALGGDLLLLSAGSVLLGFGNLLTAVSGQGYIPALSHPQEYDKRFGGLSLAISIGQSAGLPVAGAIASTNAIWGSHTTVPLLVMGALTAGATVLTLSPKFSDRRGPDSRPAAQPQGVRRMLATQGMRPAIFSSLIVLTSVDMMTAYMPAFGEQHNFSVLIITLILTARSVSSALSRLFLTRLLRAAPRPWLLASATMGSALPIALIPAFPYPPAVGLIMVIAGLFWGIGQPLTMTWVANLVAPSSRASALSLRLTGNRLGQVVLPLAAGVLAGTAGTATVFVLTGGLLAGAGVSTIRALYGTRPSGPGESLQ